MRIVVINPYAVGARNPRASRIHFVLQCLMENNIDFLIISKNGFASRDSIHGLKDIRVNTQKENSNYNMRNRFAKWVSGFIIPDRWVFWTFYSLVKYVCFYRRKEDILWTISNPWSAHLFGLFTKPTKWVADIGDLYSQNEHHPVWNGVFSSFTIFYENKILRSADKCLVNSPKIKEYYLKKYPVDVKNMELIYSGTILNFKLVKRRESTNIRLAYFGNTFETIRTGLREIHIFEELCKEYPELIITRQFSLFGKQTYGLLEFIQNSQVLKHHCRMHNIFSDEELLEAYRQTDILVNFSNGTYPGMPSKLVEYVQSNLPILNFYQFPEEASLDFLKGINNALSVDLDRPDLQAIYDFIQKIAIQPRDHPYHNDQLKSEWMKVF
ncbi:MAG: hypothetical protein M3Q56_10175 [Bacteroidota bacterium]|nr:hypothetical protein [Bacteroidota bacterium]